MRWLALACILALGAQSCTDAEARGRRGRRQSAAVKASTLNGTDFGMGRYSDWVHLYRPENIVASSTWPNSGSAGSGSDLDTLTAAGTFNVSTSFVSKVGESTNEAWQNTDNNSCFQDTSMSGHNYTGDIHTRGIFRIDTVATNDYLYAYFIGGQGWRIHSTGVNALRHVSLDFAAYNGDSVTLANGTTYLADWTVDGSGGPSGFGIKSSYVNGIAYHHAETSAAGDGFIGGGDLSVGSDYDCAAGEAMDATHVGWGTRNQIDGIGLHTHRDHAVELGLYTKTQNDLMDGFTDWKMIFDGDTFTGQGAVTDGIGGINGYVPLAAGTDATNNGSTAGLSNIGTLTNKFIDMNASGSAYALASTGYEALPDGTNLHVRALVKFDGSFTNAKWIFQMTAGSSNLISLSTRSSDLLRVKAGFGEAATNCDSSAVTTPCATGTCLIDIHVRDTGAGGNVDVWVDGDQYTDCALATMSGLAGDGTVRLFNDDGTTTNAITDAEVLFIGVRHDNGEFSEAVHDADVTSLGL